MTKHTLLLVDDQAIFRMGLRRVIEEWPDFEIIGEASNGLDACRMCGKLNPAIVLMDVNMPIMNGVEATRRIIESNPDQLIVMLTVSDDENELFDAIRSGAQGYVLKDTPIRRLHSQLQGVVMGESPLSGVIASKMIDAIRSGEAAHKGPRLSDSRLEALTGREREVLLLLAQGLTNRDIAQRLFISERTVKKHLGNIFAKLHVESRAQAIILALQLKGEGR